MKKNRAQKSISGTSLIELLVVIVVFLIGILSIAQIFPGGLRILATTRAETIASTMSHSEMDWLLSHANELPQEIVPVSYSSSGGVLSRSANPVDMFDGFGPEGASIMPSTSSRPAAWGFTSNTWDVFDSSGNDIGPWQLLSGANNLRHIIGESKTVPSPRQVGPNYGCLLTLLFGPIVQGYSGNLLLYGNDLQGIEGPPTGNLVTSAGAAVQPPNGPITGDYLLPAGYGTPTYEYYLDDTTVSDPVLYIPEDSFQTTDVSHSYRLSLLVYYNTANGVQQQSFVISPLAIPATPSNFGAAGLAIRGVGQGAYYVQHIKDLAPLSGLGTSFISVNFASVRLERAFDQVVPSTTTPNPFDLTSNADGTPHNPYQYELLNPALGQVLINPLAYGYVEESQNGQPIPLAAQADYDVLDWRVLHEDFRMPDSAPYVYQLHVSNIKHVNGYEADLTYTAGIGTGLTSGSPAAVLVVDQTTGGILTTSSFSVDYHLGIITFKPNPSSWTETVNTLSPSGPTTTTFAPNPNDLSLRVYYMANGEWSCQVLKAAANYIQATSLTPALFPGEFYVQSPASGSTANTTAAIQFCKADIGQTISFDELWYQWSDGSVHVARGQSAVVKVVSGNPIVAVRDIDPQAAALDFSNGYAVKGVKGISVSVRALWNPNTVKFQGSSSNNLSVFDQYLNGWRNTTTEAVLDSGMVQQ